MAERAKLALVGCGGMGRRHLRGLAALAGSSYANVELVAVSDLNADNANFVADEAAQLLGNRPAVYGDVARMAREVEALRAASVTTDAGSHHVVATACLEAGLDVLCEKPLAVTLRGCNLVVDAARGGGRTLSVAENYRRDPINRLVRALIDDGAIGAPRLMIETSVGGRDRISITPWRHMKQTGSITLDAGVHYADILRFYLGEVRTVYGESRLHEKVRRNTGSAGPGGFYGRWAKGFPDEIEPTGEDALYAFVAFESGAVAQWTYDNAGHGLPTRGRQVYGSRASLECPGDRNWTYSFDFNDTDSKILALEYFELAECIRTGASPEVSGEEARADVALTYAPFEAGRLGRPVTLTELIDGRADVYQREIDAMLGLATTALPS
jgi:predicted dehydrogenase